MLKCWDSAAISSAKYCNPRLSADERVADLLPRLTTAEKLSRVEWSGPFSPPDPFVCVLRALSNARGQSRVALSLL